MKINKYYYKFGTILKFNKNINMKSNFLSLLMITAIVATLSGCTALEAVAQKGKVSSALNFIETGNFDKAKEAIDAALVHEKTKDWPKTYYALGRVAQTMWEKGYESNDEKLMNAWDEQLTYAYDSYIKSMELDDKDNMQKLIIVQLPALANDFLAWGAREFENGDFKKSTLAFEKLLDLQGNEIYMGQIDTVIVYNTALAAYNAKDYEKAIKYLDWSIDMKYGETTPYRLKYQVYVDEGDMGNAEKALRDAFEEYPEDEEVLRTMIQFFIDNDKKQDALDYLNMALENNPNDQMLHFAKGVMYMQTEDYDNALVSLLKAIEIKDDYFESQYNTGVCYYNKGASMIDEANNIMDPDEYNKAIEEAKGVFAKAVPFMEKAHELSPDDMDTLVSLKELYYRLQMTDKYNETMAKISELEGGE